MSDSENQFMSLAPEDMVKGGLLDDVDVKIIHARIKVWDYDPFDMGNGTMGIETLALRLDLKELESGDESFQMWSIGDVSQFAPVDDGDREGAGIGMTGDRTAFVQTSNFGMLMASLVDCGVPQSKLKGGRVDVLEGIKMHVIRTAAPKRPGLASSDKDNRDKTILVCSAILPDGLPWDKKGKKASKRAAPKKATTSTPAAEVSSEINDQAVTMLVAILNQKGGAVPLKNIKAAGLSVLVKEKVTSDAAVRKAILDVATDAEWLAENGFELTDGEVSLQ